MRLLLFDIANGAGTKPPGLPGEGNTSPMNSGSRVAGTGWGPVGASGAMNRQAPQGLHDLRGPDEAPPLRHEEDRMAVTALRERDLGWQRTPPVGVDRFSIVSASP